MSESDDGRSGYGDYDGGYNEGYEAGYAMGTKDQGHCQSCRDLGYVEGRTEGYNEGLAIGAELAAEALHKALVDILGPCVGDLGDAHEIAEEALGPKVTAEATAEYLVWRDRGWWW